MQAFNEHKVPSLAHVRASLRRCLCSKHAELRVMQSSLIAMSNPELLDMRRHMLGSTLTDLSSLGAHAEELCQLLNDVAVLAYVVKSLVQVATPQRQQARCAPLPGSLSAAHTQACNSTLVLVTLQSCLLCGVSMAPASRHRLALHVLDDAESDTTRLQAAAPHSLHRSARRHIGVLRRNSRRAQGRHANVYEVVHCRPGPHVLELFMPGALTCCATTFQCSW